MQHYILGICIRILGISIIFFFTQCLAPRANSSTMFHINAGCGESTMMLFSGTTIVYSMFISKAQAFLFKMASGSSSLGQFL